MSTVKKDRDGNVLEEVPGTAYHKDGTGPRDADGKLIRNRPAKPDQAAPAASAAPAAAKKGADK